MTTRVLPEHEGLALAHSFGFEVPPHRLLGPLEEVDQELLDAFPGDRVVLKARVRGLSHKTEAGGVEVVPRDVESVRSALDEMGRRLGQVALDGFLLQAFVPHQTGMEGELLVTVRDTREFGPVVTVGPGGTLTEFWSSALGPEDGPLHVSSAGWDASFVRDALLERPWGRMLHSGIRGRGGRLALDRTEALMASLLSTADEWIRSGLLEAEFNPVVVTPDGDLVAVDALVRVRDGTWGVGEPAGGSGLLPGEGDSPRSPGSPPETRARDLSPLLEPGSMAIMGVSAKGMNPGRIILRNTLAEGFPPHRIWVVKPGQAELDGCTCVDSLEDLPERVDTLVLAIPASDVPEAVAEAVFGERARSIVLIPGGLGEAEGTGDRVDSIRRTLAEARARGLPDVPLNGGNCLGIRSARARTNSLFIPRYKLSFPDKTPDPLAFISQSGAFAVARLSAWPELNPLLVATVGNQVDVTVGDYLEAVLERPEIRVTALYVEGFRPADGRRVLRAARALRDQGRAVVIYRAGRTAAGKEASASHTASLAGDAVVTASACRAAGALVADTLEEFDGLVSLSLALGERPLRGRRLAALSNAGFECVALMDHAAGLDMAEFNPETVGRIQGQLDRAGVGEIVRAANPLDLTPMMGDEGFEALVRAVLEDEAVDLALVGCVPLTGALDTLPAGAGHEESLLDPGSLAQRLVRLWRETTIPWAAVVDGGPRFDPMVTILQKAGMPVFRSGDQAARILSSYASWRMGTGSQREA